MVIIAVMAAPSPGGTVQLFENFDTDPGWDTHNNHVTAPPRTVTQDFGYRTSNNAGAAPGEIGGIIDRSPLETSYYGQVLSTPLTLEQPLSFSGQLAVRHASHTVGFHTSSDVFVGFFNSEHQGWRPPNFLGFRLHGFNEPDPNVAAIELSYGTSAWSADGLGHVAGTVFPDGAKHTFAVNYNPSVANGVVTFSWNGGPAQTLEVRAPHRAAGASFNRFGIFSNQLPGVADGNTIEAYFDDLTVNGVTHDFATNPNWEGVRNQKSFQDPHLYGTNDFGYRPTNRAGGNSPGEAGGLFWRVEEYEEELQAYYADDVGTLTMNDRLVASGKIAAEQFSIDSGVMLGWFNSAEQDWRPSNFIGVYMDSFTSVGRHFTPMYGTKNGTFTPFADQPWPLLRPDGTSMDWTIEYDPDAAGGLGAITVTLDDMIRTLVLEAGARAEGAVFDRFGLFNMQDNNGKHALVYIDDVTYTSAVPEPAAAAAASCALAALLAASRSRSRRGGLE